MRIKQIFFSVFLFSLFLLTPSHSYGQSNSKSSKQEKETGEILQRRVPIVQEAGGLLAKVDLGDLPPGTKCAVNLELFSDLEVSLPIKKMETTCKCIQVRTEGNEIPPGGSLAFDFSITTPTDSSVDSPVQLFNIFYSDENCISVYVRYRFSGLVGFKNAAVFHTTSKLGAVEHEFDIPVLITEPVKLDSVSVKGTGQLAKAKFNLHTAGENQLLKCKVALDPKSPVVQLGGIELAHEKTGKTARLSVVVQPSGGVNIAPARLRFQKIDSDDDQQSVKYQASAIASVDKSLLSFQDTEQTIEIPIDIDTSIDSGKLKSQTRRLSNGVYRIAFTLTLSKDEQQPTKVDFDFKTKERTVEKEILVGFDTLSP